MKRDALSALRASRLPAVVLWAFMPLALPAAAHASLSWSSPRAVDPEASGVALNRVACPSVTQCTSVDGAGHALTFNPQSPQGTTTAIVSTNSLTGIACPSTTQCTAIDLNGQATTFDPQSSAGGSPTVIDPHAIPLSLTCPSTTQCTAVDLSGQAVTFNPQALASAPAPTSLDPSHALISVSCPGRSTSWCVAVDSTGSAIAFAPSGGAQPATQIDTVPGATVVAAACSPAPSSKQCAMVDNAANGLAFQAPPNQPAQHGSSGSAETGPNATIPTALACPDDQTCVTVDQHGGEATFDPVLPIAAPAPVDPRQVISDVACPSASQCTAVDRQGQEVTFNPASPGNAKPVPIDGHTSLTSVACPSTGQCTAVDVAGSEVSFAPDASSASTSTVIDGSATGLYGIACPSPAQCTAVDNQGGVVTFNPASPGSTARTSLASGHALYSIACPSVAECTTVEDAGREITFDPRNPINRSGATIDSGHSLLAVACPTATQCSAVDDRGAEVTFDPLAPGTPTPHLIDRVPATALACPSSAQCTAVDGSGDEVTFNPGAPGQASALAVDPNGQLLSFACRTVTDCVGVDQSGRAVEGDPRGTGAWSVQSLGSASLTGIVCPSALECLAVDQPGDAIVGSSGPLPPVPGSLSAPSATGLAQQGQTLLVRHGRWSQGPTSYTYQWERCTSRGTRCRGIAGATASAYRLTQADAGHRIRVQESAWNITGPGRPALSRSTATVGGLVSLRVTLSGVSRRTPRLTFSLRAGKGTTRLTQIYVVLPVGLSLRGVRGIVISSSAQPPRAHGRNLSIRLRKPALSLSVVIPAQDLLTGAALAREARSRHRPKLSFAATAVQRDGGRTLDKLTLIPR